MQQRISIEELLAPRISNDMHLTKTSITKYAYVEPLANTYSSWDIWLAQQNTQEATDKYINLVRKRMKIMPLVNIRAKLPDWLITSLL